MTVVRQTTMDVISQSRGLRRPLDGGPNETALGGSSTDDRSDNTAHSLGALAQLPREIRRVIYGFVGGDLLRLALASKPLGRDIGDYVQSVHGASLAFKKGALSRTLRPNRQRGRSTRVIADAGTALVLQQKPHERTVAALVKCGLLSKQALELALSDRQRAFLCSDPVVEKLCYRAIINVQQMTAIPEKYLVPGGLAQAIFDGQGDLVPRMLDCGLFDLGDRVKSGCTAVHAAVYANDIKLLRQLKERGADVTVCSNGGVSPADLARRLGRSKEFFDVLGQPIPVSNRSQQG